jgi:tetracycline resistance efflux pump
MAHYGVLSLIPVIFVITIAVVTKRTFEPLLIGSLVGFITLHGTGFFMPWVESMLKVTGDNGWTILLFSLFGSFLALIEKSGGAMGFSNMAGKHIKSRSSALITTWILGIIVFVDDYLNALVVGSVMRNVTDRFKVSREFLAYVINSTGAAVCVLLPFSTWAAVMAKQIESTGVLKAGQKGLDMYISAIPFMFYAWAAVFIVPLIILKIIPIFGQMKKAEQRAYQTGQAIPSYNINQYENTQEYQTEPDDVVQNESIQVSENVAQKKGKVINFAIPMIVLAGVTIYMSDMVVGVLLALASCAILYFSQRLMNFNQFFDIVVEGVKDMIPAMMLILSAYFLQDANDALGLTPYVIEKVQPIMSPAVLPAVSFVIVALIAFATGSFWGVAAIAYPIILPLAQLMGVNIALAVGAVVSGVALGSHACFYSDAVTLTCAATQIKNSDYARTTLPILTMPFLIAIVVFLVIGIFI